MVHIRDHASTSLRDKNLLSKKLWLETPSLKNTKKGEQPTSQQGGGARLGEGDFDLWGDKYENSQQDQEEYYDDENTISLPDEGMHEELL